MVWIQFIIGAAIIITAGVRLTKYADYLSDRLRLGKLWIGAVLLGMITSLPEAVTSLVAIIKLNAPNLAVGNLLGSNNFNPLLLVVMDLVYRQGSITNNIPLNKSHRISSFFAIFLASIVCVEIFIGSKIDVIYLAGFTPGTLMIVGFYIAGMRLLAVEGSNEELGEDGTEDKQLPSLRKIWTNIIVSAFVVIAAAIMLTTASDTIAEKTGLGRTFVGSIFLAFVTSLPELVVSLSAMRLGSFDLAIGNIFGSNMSNMFILGLCGLFSGEVPLLQAVDQSLILTGLLSVWMCFVAINGIQIKGKKTYAGLGLDSIIMAGSFLLGTWILYGIK